MRSDVLKAAATCAGAKDARTYTAQVEVTRGVAIATTGAILARVSAGETDETGRLGAASVTAAVKAAGRGGAVKVGPDGWQAGGMTGPAGAPDQAIPEAAARYFEARPAPGDVVIELSGENLARLAALVKAVAGGGRHGGWLSLRIRPSDPCGPVTGRVVSGPRDAQVTADVVVMPGSGCYVVTGDAAGGAA